MKINQTDEILEIIIDNNENSRKEALSTLTYYLQDVVDNIIDQAVYTNYANNTLQFFGQNNTYFVEYIKRNSQNNTWISYNLRHMNNQKNDEFVEFYSGESDYKIKQKSLLTYENLLDILTLFISAFDDELFLSELFEKFSITTTVHGEKKINGDVEYNKI